MRIERLDIEGFGRLSGFDSGEEALPSLVVVLGPNEAGKSTLFEFLTTMLHGFLPASRDLNPFVPWGTDEARGSLDLRLEDGQAATVTRRLRSQPAGQLSLDGAVTDLRNHPLPWAEHVPRRVFRQVFAITLGELASLDDETWARIQDRVVGSMGAADLEPVRSVASELEREAGELWRPNRRGNQKVRAARDRIRELRGRRREASERDRELRRKVEELERVRHNLHALRERRARDEVVLERAQVLVPIRAQLERIDGLRAEGGPMELLADLPPSPHDRLRKLQEEARAVEQRLSDLEAERATPEEQVAMLTPDVRTLLDRRDEVTRFVSSAARVAADRDRVVEIGAEITALEEGLDRLTRELVGTSWSEAPRDELLDLTPSRVRDLVERIERARRRTAVGERELESGDGVSGGAGLAGAMGLTAAGLVLAVWGLASAAMLPATLGVALTTTGAALAWLTLRERRARAVARAERRREAEEAHVELRDATAEFREMVESLAVASRHVDEPGPSFVTAVERLHDLAGQRHGKLRAQEEATGRIEAIAAEGRALAARVSVECGPDEAPEEVAALLSDRLRRAERIEQAADTASRELERLDREEGETRKTLEDVQARITALREAAKRFGEDAPSKALEHASGRMKAHERARQLEEELERGHPDLPRLRKRIEEAHREGATWLTDEGEIADRKARIQQVTEEIEELKGRTDALTTEIEHARTQETADWVDGQIATLEAEIGSLVRERDRKWVLARLLREADRRFREAHQPDLMRRAGAHLAHLTGGRYDRFLVEEADDGDLFKITGAGVAGPIPLRHPISTGTLEQAYMSLRLAIVDHLDSGEESLPLFIDEVFVNWDAERRARGLEVVASMADERQIFVFTCHPYLAGELRDRGAGLIELEGA
ncbi:MAG: AAA family ATPase [Gemmatimonadota bacterium]|nr:AAA family ATPase [Gemmatimonadota bacterium]